MKRLALILGLATFTTPTLATPISFTGAEFANLTGITFPTGARRIVGDSLRIDATANNAVIAALPLDQFNVDVSDFEVQINITRLLNDAGIEVQNPAIHLSDGLNLFGGDFFTGSSTDLRVGATREELASDGQSLIFREEFGNSANTPVAVNSNYLATIRVQARATSTVVAANINNGAVSSSGTTGTRFDFGNGGPSLILASTPFNSNYLINSVTFTRGVSAPSAVAEPGALGELALGLAMLSFGLYRRRAV